MKIRALTSFASPKLTMYKGEVRDCGDKAVISELLSVHYVEPVEEKKVEKKAEKKTVKKSEKKTAKKPRKKKTVGDEK